MSKYYTPSLEEFRVGFEYEILSGFHDGTVKSIEQYKNGNWSSDIVHGINDLTYIDRSLRGKNAEKGLCGIRVKYLDSDDIISVGFKLINDNYPWQYTNGVWKIKTPIHTVKQGVPENARITIHKGGDEESYFDGIIKNLNELKQILTMIGVDYE